MTTILSVRRDEDVAIGGDGQVTLDDRIVKHGAAKLRTVEEGRIVVGFAGGAADAIELMERFEETISKYQAQTERACIELARKWRTSETLRPLESLMAVVDREHSLLVSGNGDVISPDDGILSVGSGSSPALAASRSLLRNTDLGASQIVRRALEITSEIDVYTNQELMVKTPG